MVGISVVGNEKFKDVYNLNPSKSTSGNLPKETILNTTKYAPKSLDTKIFFIALFIIVKTVHNFNGK